MRLTRKTERIEEEGWWCDYEGEYFANPLLQGRFDDVLPQERFDHYGYPCDGEHHRATVVVDEATKYPGSDTPQGKELGYRHVAAS